MAKHNNLSIQEKSLAGVRKVFGEEFQSAKAFTPELLAQGIVGAARVTDSADPNKVFTLGEGGRLETAESFLERFGTAEQKGIVGEITLEQARLLGITEFDQPTTAQATSDVKTNIETATGEDEEEEQFTIDTSSFTSDDLTKASESLVSREDIVDILDRFAKPPEIPDFATDFEALRAAPGLVAAEKKLTDINEEIAEIQIAQRAAEADIRRKPGEELVSARAVRGALGEVQENARRELADLAIRKNVIIDEINSKNAVINTKMQLSQQNFQFASQQYNQEFTRALQMIDLVQAYETQELRLENDISDRALANWTVMQKTLSDNNKSFSDLTPDLQAQMDSLAIKAGVSELNELFKSIPVDPEKKVLQTIVSKDKTTMSIIFEDGTTQTIQTGLAAEAPTPGTEVSISDQSLLKIFNAEGATLSSATLQAQAAGFSKAEVAAFLDTNTKLGQGSIGDIVDDVYKESEQFLSVEFFKRLFTDKDKLEEKAKSEGFSSGFLNKNAEVDLYLESIMKAVEIRRETGLTDKEILASFPVDK